MVSFYTSDNHIESWWANPAYRVGQLLRAGIKHAVVPDFSLWDHMATAAHIWSLYRAAWMGRYFQEAGLRVIPRIEYFQEKSQKWCLDGIPTGAPIVSTQFQTDFDDEDAPKLERNLQTALDIVEPGRILIYAGKRGRALVEKFDLPCEMTVLPTSSELRKKAARFKEEDPHLLEIRKRAGRRKEASRATAQEK